MAGGNQSPTVPGYRIWNDQDLDSNTTPLLALHDQEQPYYLSHNGKLCKIKNTLPMSLSCLKA